MISEEEIRWPENEKIVEGSFTLIAVISFMITAISIICGIFL